MPIEPYIRAFCNAKQTYTDTHIQCTSAQHVEKILWAFATFSHAHELGRRARDALEARVQSVADDFMPQVWISLSRSLPLSLSLPFPLSESPLLTPLSLSLARSLSRPFPLGGAYSGGQRAMLDD